MNSISQTTATRRTTICNSPFFFSATEFCDVAVTLFLVCAFLSYSFSLPRSFSLSRNLCVRFCGKVSIVGKTFQVFPFAIKGMGFQLPRVFDEKWERDWERKRERESRESLHRRRNGNCVFVYCCKINAAWDSMVLDWSFQPFLSAAREWYAGEMAEKESERKITRERE